MRLFKMKKEKIKVGYCVRCKWTAEGTYCKKCGKEMFPAFHDCPKCGKAVHIADNFCGFCGADLDLLDWTIQCSNGQDNLAIGDSGGVKKLELTGLSEYTMYTVWVNASDDFVTIRKWYKFITKSPYEPSLPTNFVANPTNKTQINISWNNDGNNLTYLEWYTSQNWAPGDGTLLGDKIEGYYYIHKEVVFHWHNYQ